MFNFTRKCDEDYFENNKDKTFYVRKKLRDELEFFVDYKKLLIIKLNEGIILKYGINNVSDIPDISSIINNAIDIFDTF